VWYALVCVLAAVHYTGWIVPIAMLVGYGCILRSLYRLSGALDEAGYAIAPGPVRVTDRCIALVLAAVLGIGGALGYLFGSSYRMGWQPAGTAHTTRSGAPPCRRSRGRSSRGSEHARGYVASPAAAVQSGYLLNSWCNYTHQQSLLQYPAVTAMEKRMTSAFGNTGAFYTVQHALQFFPEDAQTLR